jgi:hypothetical protein
MTQNLQPYCTKRLRRRHFRDSLRDSISQMIFHYRMLCLYYVTIARQRVEHRIMVTYF